MADPATENGKAGGKRPPRNPSGSTRTPDPMIQVAILGYLSQKGPQRFSGLLAHLKTTKPTLSHHLGALSEAGDVNRKRGTGGDGRAVQYAITKAGARRLRNMSVLPAVLHELEDGGARHLSRVPRVGTGLSIVTHTIDRSPSIWWMTRGIEDKVWAGLEQGYAEHVASVVRGPLREDWKDLPQEDVIGLVYLQEYVRFQQAEIASIEQKMPTKVVVSFEIDVGRILEGLREKERRDRVQGLVVSTLGGGDGKKPEQTLTESQVSEARPASASGDNPNSPDVKLASEASPGGP